MTRSVGAAVAGALLLGASGLGFVTTLSRVNVNALRGSPAGMRPGQTSTEYATSGSSFISGSTCCSLVVAAAAAAVCRRAAAKEQGPTGEEIAKTLPRPENLLESPKFPKFVGTSGGYFSRSTRERHAITWTAKEEAAITFPTGGVAIMNKGENLAYFRKKEQCICVGKALRQMKIENYKIFRIAKDGTVKFMHPADGVFPDKVNAGRVPTNYRAHTCCGNAQQGQLRFTKYHQKAFEADKLTTMFVKAKLMALQDRENLFAVPPKPNPAFSGMNKEETDDYVKRYNEEMKKLVKSL